MSYFNLQEKIEQLRKELNESSDFSFRIYYKNKQKIAFVYLKSIIDNTLLSESIYDPIQSFGGVFTIKMEN